MSIFGVKQMEKAMDKGKSCVEVNRTDPLFRIIVISV